MTVCATYAIGRGKPPLHTRFRKGQSGNPSGKPGPAKLARVRFQRAFYALLEAREAEVRASPPADLLDGIARRMVLDAANGRIPAVRMVLSLLDKESRIESLAEGLAEAPATEQDGFSLVQGKTQGSEKEPSDGVPLREDSELAPTTRTVEPASADATARNGAESFSLVQGKKQGNGKIPAQRCSAAPRLAGLPAAAHTQSGRRASLLMGSAAISQGNITGFGAPPP
jgi:hypothetical protein